LKRPFKIVLHEPEIPQNTGSIGRLCLSTQSELHLIEPLGFELTDKYLKRAGLDYWQYINLKQHKNFESFLEQVEDKDKLVFFSKKSGTTHFEYSFQQGSYLVFGKETAGLPDWILEQFPDQIVRIPMVDARVRSLNLAMATGIGLYEAIRQNTKI